MLAPWALVAAVALSVGCRKPHAGSPEGDAPRSNRAPEPEVKMTDMDPKSPEAWRQAEAIAATVAIGELERSVHELPFLFRAKFPPWILVHQGKVVTGKGAAVAGSYLRDLGIIDGKGPGIKDVLALLHALKAWPAIEGVREQAYVGLETPTLEELGPTITLENDVAHVVLNYFLPEPEPPPEDLENDVGSVDPNSKPAIVKPMARAVLVIPRSGAPGWKPIETFNWVDER
jgi:hypothetical protein